MGKGSYIANINFVVGSKIVADNIDGSLTRDKYTMCVNQLNYNIENLVDRCRQNQARAIEIACND